MNIRELILEAEMHEHRSLSLLLDYLVNEKKTVKLTDDIKVLDLYFLPKHKERLNSLLGDYIQQRRREVKL